MMRQLKIDHVTIAGNSLQKLDDLFADIGLATDYGGPHSNGITHMSLLGFDDGSYIELISTLEPGEQKTAFWGKQIAHNGGPCAWAVTVDDVAAESERMARLGITVDGPHYYHRRRPDGQLVEWNLSFLGNKGAGATLPFIIKDITPRHLRVRPSASVAGSTQQPALLTGVAAVVLGAQNLPDALDLFRRAYNWPAPQFAANDTILEAMLSGFENSPVILATPKSQNSWLAKRLAQFGDSPCAYLLGARDFEAACRQFGLAPAAPWFGRQIAWFDSKKPDGLKLGIIA